MIRHALILVGLLIIAPSTLLVVVTVVYTRFFNIGNIDNSDKTDRRN
jgi:hypothetical protein